MQTNRLLRAVRMSQDTHALLRKWHRYATISRKVGPLALRVLCAVSSDLRRFNEFGLCHLFSKRGGEVYEDLKLLPGFPFPFNKSGSDYHDEKFKCLNDKRHAYVKGLLDRAVVI
jgi:hypothetical protein